MERLTYDYCVGNIHCWQIKGADNLECGEVCKQRDMQGCEGCPISRAFDRLASIENILGDEYDIDRLRELVNADREGRCVMLPCKVGDTVYEPNKRGFVSTYKIISIHVSECSTLIGWELIDGIYSNINGFEVSALGETVFLTREAAEKALKEWGLEE